jgi:hypothetical protein
VRIIDPQKLVFPGGCSEVFDWYEVLCSETRIPQQIKFSRHDELNSLKKAVFQVSEKLSFDIFAFIITGDHKYLCQECGVQLTSQPNAKRCHSCCLGAFEFVTKRHSVGENLRDVIPDGDKFVREYENRITCEVDEQKKRQKEKFCGISQNKMLQVLQEAKQWCHNMKGRPWISIRGEKSLEFKKDNFLIGVPILHNMCHILKVIHNLLVTHYLLDPHRPNATKAQLEAAFRDNLKTSLSVHLGAGFWNGEVFRRVFSHRPHYLCTLSLHQSQIASPSCKFARSDVLRWRRQWRVRAALSASDWYYPTFC